MTNHVAHECHTMRDPPKPPTSWHTFPNHPPSQHQKSFGIIFCRFLHYVKLSLSEIPIKIQHSGIWMYLIHWRLIFSLVAIHQPGRQMGGPLRSRGFATLDAGQGRRRSGCGDESSERFQAHFAIFARPFPGWKAAKIMEKWVFNMV